MNTRYNVLTHLGTMSLSALAKPAAAGKPAAGNWAQEKGLLPDEEKMETAMYLEKALSNCYEALGMLVHDRAIRTKTHLFAHGTQRRLRQLKEMFELDPLMQGVIERKMEQYSAQFNPLKLSVAGITDLAVGLATRKLDIFKYLGRTCTRYQKIFNGFLTQTVEELRFLRFESDAHGQPDGAQACIS